MPEPELAPMTLRYSIVLRTTGISLANLPACPQQLLHQHDPQVKWKTSSEMSTVLFLEIRIRHSAFLSPINVIRYNG